MTPDEQWSHFSDSLLRYPNLGFSLDLSRIDFTPGFDAGMADACEKAFQHVAELESGSIANPDEGRMVGHYWLRDSKLSPNETIQGEIEEAISSSKTFANRIHTGEILPPSGGQFESVLVIGIGGSALGPQLAADALATPGAALNPYFLDNTDPDGIDRVMTEIGDGLAKTLAVVISKSGGTPETRNGMLEAIHAYEKAGLDFGKYAVAVTGPGSKLDKFAEAGGWMQRFSMPDWIGGRTSITGIVGLVPAALIGIDVDAFLEGAAAMDTHTRVPVVKENAAMQLALAWHHCGNGRGEKDMVVLPYKDRLVLFSKYLQQLVMESLGKEHDLNGNVVNQGIAVYGNKGSTDQHAYIQQLRDGLNNFFATFIEVRRMRDGESPEVEDGVNSGDFLQGFLRGTRSALYGNNRESVTISVDDLDARSLGALIALFERAVTFYASLVNINAYHQPGVEAGKKAAADFLDLLKNARETLLASGTSTAAEISGKVDGNTEDIYHALNHLEANDPRVRAERGSFPAEDRFSAAS
ncbi:MAG: glucose-6-phosphate isomerase [Verrucomicrobiota bacterium]